MTPTIPPASWDQKALELATAIRDKAHRDASMPDEQLIALIQCAVIDGMQWVAPPAAQVKCPTCRDVGVIGHSDICPDCSDSWKPAAQVAVSDGNVLVPREPTHEMVDTLISKLIVTNRGTILNPKQALQDALSAAPAQPQQSAFGETQAARDVLRERERQIAAEGWTPAHDDEHACFEMADAAGCYAHAAAGWSTYAARDRWPWSLEWWKPSTPRRNLIKAGALILAEIERLDRAEQGESGDDVPEFTTGNGNKARRRAEAIGLPIGIDSEGGSHD